MTNIRLLPVVVMAIAALLVFKTVGLITNGGYVLTGVTFAEASGASAAPGAGEPNADHTLTLPAEPTIQDSSPTMNDAAPTMEPQSQAQEAGAGGHGGAAPAAEPAADHGTPAAEGAADPAAHGAEGAATDPAASPEGATATSGTYCLESDAAIDADGNVLVNPALAATTEGAASGEAAAAPPPTINGMPAFAASMADCLPTGDAVPQQIDGQGGSIPLLSTDASSETEKLLLQRLAARRDELKKYEDDLTLRSSIVDAAEKRIEDRTATLTALEAQISTLVDQRKEMETGQFAGIVAMYETMKPKDAANIFNNLDMEVLLRVAKTMSPRKMAPILAAMDTTRAQDLTVQMAALADKPVTEMSPSDLAALPQIVGK
ncbi:MAG: MotE family protein [Devosia sp.]